MSDLLEYGFLASAATVVAAFLAKLASNRKAKSDREEAVLEEQTKRFDSLVDALQEQLKAQAEDIASLNERLAAQSHRINEVESKNDDLRSENQRLRYEIATKDEVIDGTFKWLEVWQRWYDDGAHPPPPTYTWQMRHHMERLKEAATGLDQAGG